MFRSKGHGIEGKYVKYGEVNYFEMTKRINMV